MGRFGTKIRFKVRPTRQNRLGEGAGGRRQVQTGRMRKGVKMWKRRPESSGVVLVCVSVVYCLPEHGIDDLVRDGLRLRNGNVSVAHRGTDVSMAESDLDIG
jgi:hypothetical protein